jgi:hypothetical protein
VGQTFLSADNRRLPFSSLPLHLIEQCRAIALNHSHIAPAIRDCISRLNRYDKRLGWILIGGSSLILAARSHAA